MRYQLPPVFLLVLYNGSQRWSAPTSLSELIGLRQNSALWNWQPQVRYYLLDMGAFAGRELVRRTSLAALLFRLEQKYYETEELEKLIEEVVGWFRRHEGFGGLQCLFGELVRQAIRHVVRGVRIPEELSEMKSNLDALGRTWRDEWLAEGMALGRAEGKVEGIAEGKAAVLLSLLAKRFGPLTSARRKRIGSAKLATIELWLDRAIDAPNLSSVFSPRR
jgi:hypothetical protein